MLREFVRLDWERRRGPLLLTCVVFVLVPVAALLSMAGSRGGSASGVMLSQNSGVVLMTALCGGALAWGAGTWADERRGNWVYALSLPLSRAQLFGYRYVAGLLWLLVPLAVLGVTAFVVAGAASLPAGVYAYPGAFFRWAVLACWFLYTLMFVAAARWERPWVALLLFVVALFVVQLPLSFGVFPTLVGGFEALVYGAASPLRVLTDGQTLFAF